MNRTATTSLHLPLLGNATLNPNLAGVHEETMPNELRVGSLGFKAKSLVLPEEEYLHLHKRSSSCVSTELRWWEKGLKPNILEIHSASQLVDALASSSDRLAVVSFYSPGCGACKSLHPKISQLAEQHPAVNFLKINYEELKSLCYSLNVHVLPFFKFYRGAEGRICSFSCTIATIKKLKDALAKHGVDFCSLEPAKGLDASEMQRLASIGQLAAGSSWNENRLSYGFGYASGTATL